MMGKKFPLFLVFQSLFQDKTAGFSGLTNVLKGLGRQVDQTNKKRRLTTHRVACLEDALQCVVWYRQRWHIEQLFRTLKKQGLNVEGSQVETGEGLTKLACLAIQAAVRTLQLTLARDADRGAQAAEVFDAHEIKIVQKILPTLEGKTQKQKNPHRVGSLAQAAWVVARLGGWKGYASEAKPGPITMLRGLQRIEAICEGWKLAM
jgi:hypothetical protein